MQLWDDVIKATPAKAGREAIMVEVPLSMAWRVSRGGSTRKPWYHQAWRERAMELAR